MYLLHKNFALKLQAFDEFHFSLEIDGGHVI